MTVFKLACQAGLLMMLYVPLSALSDPESLPATLDSTLSGPVASPTLLEREMRALETIVTRTDKADSAALKRLGMQVAHMTTRLAHTVQTQDASFIAYHRWLAQDMQSDARHLQASKLALQQAGLAGLHHSLKLYRQHFRTDTVTH